MPLKGPQRGPSMLALDVSRKKDCRLKGPQRGPSMLSESKDAVKRTTAWSKYVSKISIYQKKYCFL